MPRQAKPEIIKIAVDNTNKKPSPPSSMNKEAKAVWKKTVDTLPAGWFTDETLALLGNYCTHIAEGNRLSTLLQKYRADFDEYEIILDDDKLKTVDKLLKMIERESRAAVSLATKLRITQQSTRSSYSKKEDVSQIKKPWEKK